MFFTKGDMYDNGGECSDCGSDCHWIVKKVFDYGDSEVEYELQCSNYIEVTELEGVRCNNTKVIAENAEDINSEFDAERYLYEEDVP